jgi:dihydrofolate reductase
MSFIGEIDTVLYGRVSYEKWGNPLITEESSEFEKQFYGELTKMDRYVFSTTKTHFEGNAQIVSSGISDLIRGLRGKPGKHIWLYGGASLISTFMNLNLVDEFRLAIMPSILGSGKLTFQNIARRINLKLIDSRSTESGVIAVRYDVVR